MGITARPNSYTSGTTIKSSEVNADFNAIYGVVNGNITDENISSSAGISYSKLNLSGSITETDLSTGASISQAYIDWADAGYITADSVSTSAINLVNAINEISTDSTMVGNSDLAVPTERAVKGYVDSEIAGIDGFGFEYVTGGAISGSSFQPTFTVAQGYIYKMYVYFTMTGLANGLGIDDYSSAGKYKGSEYGAVTIYHGTVSSADNILGLTIGNSSSLLLEFTYLYNGSTTKNYIDARGTIYNGAADVEMMLNSYFTYTGATSNPTYNVGDRTLTGRYFVYRTKQ